MCCTGHCKYEINDFDNGGTKCMRRKGQHCLMEEEEAEKEGRGDKFLYEIEGCEWDKEDYR